MAKAKYLTDEDGNRTYAVSHTGAVYDGKGAALEKRLDDDEAAIAGKAERAHTHTKAEIEDFPESIPPGEHTHEIDEVNELRSELDENAAAIEDVRGAITDIESGNLPDGAIGADKVAGVEFAEAEDRTNISSGEKLGALFGKIRKWFTDLKAVAFTGSYTDLTDKPTIPAAVTVDASLDGTSANPVQNKAVKSALDEKSPTGHMHTRAEITDFPESMPASDVPNWAKQGTKPSYTKSEVGLSNVPNVATNDQTPTFTAATSRANISSGDKLSVIFGKLAKWYTDLKNVAWTGSYNDLTNKPTIPTIPTTLPNPSSLTLTMNGTATTYNGASSQSKSWYAPTSYGTAGYELVANGSGSAPVWKQPSYAVCSTAAVTQTKTVSVSNFKRATGVHCYVKFSSANTASSPMLNVNSTGAAYMRYNGANITSDMLKANIVYDFVYDGTYWNLVGEYGGGASTATFVCSTQAEFENAIDNFPSTGGTIFLKKGRYEVPYTPIEGQPGRYSRAMPNTNIVIEGESPKETILEWWGVLKNCSSEATITFRSLYLLVNGPTALSKTRINVIDCNVYSNDSGGKTIAFCCQYLYLRGCKLVHYWDYAGDDEIGCHSFIDMPSDGFVDIDGCDIGLGDDGSISYPGTSDTDLNLIYGAGNGNISNCRIICNSTGRANIVNNGNVNMSNNIIILKNAYCNIAHYNDSTTPTAAFTGNHVEIRGGTYMRFGAITGNAFDTKAATTLNLLCPTNMQGNTFKGNYGVTINCQQHKSIVVYNLSDGTMTVSGNPTGGLSSNNLSY